MALERDVQRIAARIFAALDTPRSLTAEILRRYGEWDQLVNLSMDPSHYADKWDPTAVEKFRRDAVATNLLRKCQNIDTGKDLHREAVRTFFEAEAQCLNQNNFLRDWFSLNGEVITTPKGAPASMRLLCRKLNRARKWIKKTLGGLPMSLDGRFGPGATFESAGFDRRLLGFGLTAYDKISNLPTCSENVPEWLEDHLVWKTAYGRAWGQVSENRVIPRVPGNRFTSVPKDAKKNRGICMEPGLNILGQLALGSEVRSRLMRRGLLQKNAKDLHSRMAMQASRDGCHATLDLSNASDTICYYLVQLLLPCEWFELMDSLRSPYTQIGDRQVKLEKFSSMGNGYTFELETLIFASLVHTCGGRIGHDSSVFGDDTIVPTAIANEVCMVYQLCGFTINQKKSYLSGPFRESCGGDYFSGVDVRPYYLKEAPHDPATWISFHNGLASLSSRFTMRDFEPVLRAIIDQIPTSFRSFGPHELGDLVLHGPLDKWAVRVVDGIRYVSAIVPLPRKKSLRRYAPTVALTAAVLGLPSDGLSPRNSVGGYRRCWLPFS